MSADVAADITCCAGCGTAEVDDIKLKKCTCHLVKYCSVECQKNHRKQHKKECKKRMAELREELLFRQPESTHYGDCPICFVPLSLGEDKSSLTSCCCVYICDGCGYANQMKDAHSMNEPTCPFCREAYPTSVAEAERNVKKRIEAGDRVAIRQRGVQGAAVQDYTLAFDFLTKAATMGDFVAHYNLANMYSVGHGVETDIKKAVYHWEEAAIGGHPDARYNLGANDAQNCKFDKSVKHWIIAASLGHDVALGKLKEWYANGSGTVSKTDLAAALRAHQAFVDSTKSAQREEAAHFCNVVDGSRDVL